MLGVDMITGLCFLLWYFGFNHIILYDFYEQFQTKIPNRVRLLSLQDALLGRLYVDTSLHTSDYMLYTTDFKLKHPVGSDYKTITLSTKINYLEWLRVCLCEKFYELIFFCFRVCYRLFELLFCFHQFFWLIVVRF